AVAFLGKPSHKHAPIRRDALTLPRGAEMTSATGHTVPLSLAQRFVGDLVHLARSLPRMTLGRRVQLPAAGDRFARYSLLARAFSVAAARRPELRRAYLPCPRPRLYEHPFSIAAIAVVRPVGETEGLLLARVRAPEGRELRDIERRLRRCAEGPLE